MSLTNSLMYTRREEGQGTLAVLEGLWPAGLTGCFFLIYPVGSVNTSGLPVPQGNTEYGTPLMNGDGMVLRIDFDRRNQGFWKTRLMKTPCYWSDHATREGTALHRQWGYKNYGIARMSRKLGLRNLLNTALIPFQFEGQSSPALLVTYDVGRPYVLDPESLSLVGPVGQISEWATTQPSLLNWPFGVVQTSAHPVFDPRTREFFSVNFTSPSGLPLLKSVAQGSQRDEWTPADRELVELATKHAHDSLTDEVLAELQGFLVTLAGRVPHFNPSEPAPLNIVRWDGVTLRSWTAVDSSDTPIVIRDCLHQISITRDYLVLADCSFKFSLELLINRPVARLGVVNSFLRKLLSRPMTARTAIYLVRRRDLVVGTPIVSIRRIEADLPLETIHFSCDYENPGGRIVLHAVHNAATCIADWIRPYDRVQLTGEKVLPSRVGIFAIGAMDVSRIGTWSIDAPRGCLIPEASRTFHESGSWNKPAVGPNTWAVGLYAYRDMISAETNRGAIGHLWYLSYGTDPQMLTQFIHDLYKDYSKRILPVSEVLAATEFGIPCGLHHFDTIAGRVTDSFEFPQSTWVRGVQFIPNDEREESRDLETDGFLLCPVHRALDPGSPETNATSEFWIFEAWDLARGPVLKLSDPGLRFAFTLHSTWLAKVTPYDGPGLPDQKADLEASCALLRSPQKRKSMLDFLRQNVFPHLG